MTTGVERSRVGIGRRWRRSSRALGAAACACVVVACGAEATGGPAPSLAGPAAVLVAAEDVVSTGSHLMAVSLRSNAVRTAVLEQGSDEWSDGGSPFPGAVNGVSAVGVEGGAVLVATRCESDPGDDTSSCAAVEYAAARWEASTGGWTAVELPDEVGVRPVPDESPRSMAIGGQGGTAWFTVGSAVDGAPVVVAVRGDAGRVEAIELDPAVVPCVTPAGIVSVQTETVHADAVAVTVRLPDGTSAEVPAELLDTTTPRRARCVAGGAVIGPALPGHDVWVFDAARRTWTRHRSEVPVTLDAALKTSDGRVLAGLTVWESPSSPTQRSIVAEVADGEVREISDLGGGTVDSLDQLGDRIAGLVSGPGGRRIEWLGVT